MKRIRELRLWMAMMAKEILNDPEVQASKEYEAMKGLLLKEVDDLRIIDEEIRYQRQVKG